MKWIGQHIWSFVTRFRNNVYFDELPEEDATLTKALVIDGDGKVKVNSNIGANASTTTTHIHEEVKNVETFTISAGTPVYAISEVGASGVIRVGRADASDSSKMPAIGIAAEDINADSNGDSILVGIFNTNVSGFSSLDENQVLYVAAGGGLTNVKPSGEGNLVQNVAIVLKANDEGTISQGMQVTVVGRTNDIPNLNNGNIFIGDSNNQYESKSLPDAIEDAGNITVDGDFNVTGNVNLGTNLPTTSQSNILGVDGSGNIYKQTAPSGGTGSLTIVDSDLSGSDTTFTNINEIKFFGNDIEVYQDGSNKVLVASPPLTSSPAMSFSSDPTSGYSLYRIGNPVNSSGFYFYAGDWAGQGEKRATQNTSVTFTSNICGNFLINGNPSKIKVSVYGPQDNSSVGSTNLLQNMETSVTGNTTVTNGAIQVTITNFADDGIPSRKKARVSVTVNLNSSALITTGGNFTGSQKFHSIKIQQLDSAGNAIPGVSDFTSNSFFYDNKNLPPTAGSITSYELDNTSTKQLSNIKYYSSGDFVLRTSNSSNLQRDTGYRYSSLLYTQHTGGLTNSSASDTLSGNSYNTNDNSNSSYLEMPLLNNVFKLNGSQSARFYVRGGLGGNSSYTGYSSGTPHANFMTYSLSGSSKTHEGHREEDYRISHHKIDSYKSISSAQTDSEATWKSRCVGANPTSTNNGLPTNNQHLIQGHFNGDWKLAHGSVIGTVASLPSGGMTNSTKPSSGTFSYIRFFGPFSSSTSNFSIDLGITKNTFTTHAINSSNLNVYFLIPGNGSNQGVWIPLKNTFNSGNPTNGCWANKNSQSSGSEQFDLSFGGSAKVVILKVEMNQNGPDYMGKFTMSSGHQNT